MEEAKVLDLLFFIFLSRALTGNCDPSVQPIMLIEAKGGEKGESMERISGKAGGKDAQERWHSRRLGSSQNKQVDRRNGGGHGHVGR